MTDAIAGIVKPLVWEEMRVRGWSAYDHLFYQPVYADTMKEREQKESDRITRILAALDADALQAMIGAAYEAAASTCDVVWMDGDGDLLRDRAAEIRALTHADALAAQTRRDAQNVAKGMRAAAMVIAKRKDDYIGEHGIYDYWTDVTEFPGNGSEWVEEWEECTDTILALAAQTEEAANG